MPRVQQPVPDLIHPTIIHSTERYSDSSQTKYLLLDNRIIQKTENARLIVGAVKKHQNNPLFTEDKLWEMRFDNLYGNVLYDESEQIFKLWYSPFIIDSSSQGYSLAQRQRTYNPPDNREMGICYATSRDGIHWDKPNLGLVEYMGNKQNNIIWRGPHGAGIFQDVFESDPERRFKTIFQGLLTSVSSDGIHWAEPTKCTGVSVAGDTHNNAFWAPTLEKYVGITRTWGDLGRQVARIESDDFVNWTREELVLEGRSKRDQPYAMPVFFYSGVYLGLLVVYDRKEDRAWTELTWSPDTQNWHRISPGTPLIPNSEQELDYDYGCVYACATPIFLRDEIRLYYGASDWLHFSWRNGSLALATLRPDGFAGYEPKRYEKPAFITTNLFPYNNESIQITGDVKKGGSIKVIILNEDGEQLSQARPIIHTVTGAKISLPDSIGVRVIRLRFELNNAKLYSFSFDN
ncbi:MAG: hypothetical protein OEQ53_07385 [Saprospiraceae bacterium]|nr:hypothetical protein [Saprospiraceae bacterium]